MLTQSLIKHLSTERRLGQGEGLTSAAPGLLGGEGKTEDQHPRKEPELERP